MSASRPIRLAVLCDFPEEGWASMDLVGEMVLDQIRQRHGSRFDAERFCPPFRRRLAGWPMLGRKGVARNADRLINRFVDYPRAARRLARTGRFDLYHLVDHSYSQVVHALPTDRVVVTCHDLDTFRCLLEPAREPRPRWFRAMARRILAGLQKAAAVVCDSEATRAGLIAHRLIPAERLRVVYLGINAEFQAAPDPEADAEADRLLGPGTGRLDLLHVGSNIPRKRIDVLLDVVAAIRRERPEARLIKVGGALPVELATRARALGLIDAIECLPFIERRVLAAVYRRASLVLQPSEAEGFGLPVAEALACGAPLLASDLDVLREVGGDAPVYRPVGDVPAWTEAALTLLDESQRDPAAAQARREAGLARARLFSWSAHADSLASVYRQVLEPHSKAEPLALAP